MKAKHLRHTTHNIHCQRHRHSHYGRMAHRIYYHQESMHNSDGPRLARIPRGHLLHCNLTLSTQMTMTTDSAVIANGATEWVDS